MDTDFLVHTLGGSAIFAAALTLARLLLDYFARRGERHLQRQELRQRQQRDAEARLERILQDRLADADRRLERCQLDAQAERLRSVSLEHEHAQLSQAHAMLKEQYAVLHAEHSRLTRKQRLPAPNH